MFFYTYTGKERKRTKIHVKKYRKSTYDYPAAPDNKLVEFLRCTAEEMRKESKGHQRLLSEGPVSLKPRRLRENL